MGQFIAFVREFATLGVICTMGGTCLLACGTSSSGSSATTVGGNAGTSSTALGGASGTGGFGQGGATALDPATISKYGACKAYVQAECQRLYVECGADSTINPCSSWLDQCPDVLFSDGSQWTVQGVLSCAEVWKTYPCDQILQGKYPNCGGPAGTRVVGQGCIHSDQCASGLCSVQQELTLGDPADPHYCMTCATPAGPGEDCSNTRRDCQDGYSCGPGGTCQPTVYQGQACTSTDLCDWYLECRADPAGVNRCLPAAAAGQTCQYFCQEGYYCTSDTHICAVAPGLGQGCQVGPWNCSIGLKCDDPSSSQSRCITPGQSGASCVAFSDLDQSSCAEGLRCVCADAKCSTPGTCRPTRDEGQPCDATTVCLPGTNCVAGVCKGLDSQGLLEASCDGH